MSVCMKTKYFNLNNFFKKKNTFRMERVRRWRRYVQKYDFRSRDKNGLSDVRFA